MFSSADEYLPSCIPAAHSTGFVDAALVSHAMLYICDITINNNKNACRVDDPQIIKNHANAESMHAESMQKGNSQHSEGNMLGDNNFLRQQNLHDNAELMNMLGENNFLRQQNLHDNAELMNHGIQNISNGNNYAKKGNFSK